MQKKLTGYIILLFVILFGLLPEWKPIRTLDGSV